ncbi:MAG TPA: WD40 repeat domain-containing protein [candidate division Zixibacteria bacterium]|nr:WD40 repeat domain-containing protein [candidate division Zixibacteria bacterium]
MQFRAIRAPFLFIAAFLVLALTVACGGGGAKNLPASITANPSSISAARGDVVQLSLSAQTSSGSSTTADYNFVSQDTSLATVNSGGQVCAGQWDTAGINCTAATSTGQTNIVVTPQKGNGSAVVTVYVHQKVDYIQAAQPSGCTSSTQLSNVTAKAYSKDSNFCSQLNSSAPCVIPSNTLGPFSWTARDTSVVAFNNSGNAYGVASAANPGRTQIYATLGDTSSPSVSFTTCPIVKLTLTASSATNGVITLATGSSGNTATLTAVATDSSGTDLTDPPIQWVTSNSYSASLSETAATSTVAATHLNYTVTAAHSGSTATIMVDCVPTGCNLNLPPIYGPSYVVDVTGTTAATVWAGATNSKTLVPIDISKNTAGTSITLPAKPNSFIMNKQGSYGLLGADSGGAMVLTGSGSVSTVSYNGKAIAISPDGTTGVLSDLTDGYVYLVTLSSASVAAAIPISNDITSAAFSPDSSKIWMTDNTGTLITWDNNNGVLKYSLTSPANSAAFLANGPVAYVNSGTNIQARATCDPTQVVDTQTFSAPSMLRPIPDASGVVAIDLPNVDILKNATATQNINNSTFACTTTLTESNSRATLPNSSLTVNHFEVSPDSSKAVITTSNNAVYIVNLSDGSVKSITTGTTSLYEGGFVADSSLFYTGGSDGMVHKIDLSAGSDAQQITINLKDVDGNNTNPNLVQVRYQ